MDKINPEEIAQKYNSIDVIWDESDKWHIRTNRMIREFIWNSLKKIPNSKDLKILNAGSAGYSYELDETNITHIDIADKKIAHLSNKVIGSIEKIPITDNVFDLIICVGSVLNYCDPMKVIEEFRRVLKNTGYLILEFESSRTFELILKHDYNRSAVFVETFYKGGTEKIWYFSEDYIKRLGKLYGFELLCVDRCHILSPLIYRITKSEGLAAWFGKWDTVYRKIPLINRNCSNAIYLFGFTK